MPQNSVVIKPGYQETKDCVGFVVVYNELTYIALEGHLGEGPSEIVVQNSCALVRKRCETKNISYRAVVLFNDDRRAVIERSCLEQWFGDVGHPTVFVCNRDVSVVGPCLLDVGGRGCRAVVLRIL